MLFPINTSMNEIREETDMGLALKDTQHHCYGDYLTWPDDSRYELIDGSAYAMSPAPDLAHQDVAGEIYRQTANILAGKSCRAFIAPVDVRLPKHNEADESIDTVVQPDVLVVCDSSKLDRRGVRGAPDWIVEVLSPSTAGHDQIKKRNLYERHGVKEYWLIHPMDRVLTVYHLIDGEYGKPELYELNGETQVSALPDIVIRWDELVMRLPVDY
jgi:Uma2 family endonuclease